MGDRLGVTIGRRVPLESSGPAVGIVVVETVAGESEAAIAGNIVADQLVIGAVNAVKAAVTIVVEMNGGVTGGLVPGGGGRLKDRRKSNSRS